MAAKKKAVSKKRKGPLTTLFDTYAQKCMGGRGGSTLRSDSATCVRLVKEINQELRVAKAAAYLKGPSTAVRAIAKKKGATALDRKMAKETDQIMSEILSGKFKPNKNVRLVRA